MTDNVQKSLTILEIRDRVKQSEARIRGAVARELEVLFEAGISPDHVAVDLIDVTALGDQVRRRVVSEVRLDVPLK